MTIEFCQRGAVWCMASLDFALARRQRAHHAELNARGTLFPINTRSRTQFVFTLHNTVLLPLPRGAGQLDGSSVARLCLCSAMPTMFT